jgi:FkbM family methyltransferase
VEKSAMKLMSILRRFLDRFRFWVMVLKHGRGISPKLQVGLVLSSILDTFVYSISPLLALSPRTYISGVVYFKNCDVYFYVRKFSDDLYNVTPGREGDVNRLILKSLSEGDVFIDVGANIGYYSILAARIVGKQGQVIALEPVPNTVKVLDLNIKLNNLKNIKIIPKAAWSNSAPLKIYVPGGCYGWASPIIRPDCKSLTVDAVPLDDVSEKIPAIKLLKIDVEGSECRVIVGARGTLKKTENVVMEVSENSEIVQQILKDAAFKIRKLKFATYIHASKG